MRTKHKKDDFGNLLTMHNTGHLHLQLKEEKRPRFIGRLVKENHIWHYEKQLKEEHRMIKNDSWGLNFSIIEPLDPNSVITIRTEKAIYSATVRDVKEYGEFLHFKTQGFERQIFLPLKHWTAKELT